MPRTADYFEKRQDSYYCRKCGKAYPDTILSGVLYEHWRRHPAETAPAEPYDFKKDYTVEPGGFRCRTCRGFFTWPLPGELAAHTTTHRPTTTEDPMPDQPKPINPADIRAGDKILITDTRELTVTEIKKEGEGLTLYAGTDYEETNFGEGPWTRTFTLVERAEPVKGSRWVDPELRDIEWYYVGDGRYVSDTGLRSWTMFELRDKGVGMRAAMIARLVPAGDKK